MMIGGALAGLAGDRFGRRVALLGSTLLFGVMTLVVAAVDDVTTLAVVRFVTGIGLGGAMPNAAALVAEYVPVRQRPMAVTIAIVCVPLGATLAGLVAIPLIPLFGWRTLFVVGGLLPLVAVALLVRVLPESPRFLARHANRWSELRTTLARMGHEVAADATFADRQEVGVATRASIGTLFRSPFLRDTVALWASFFSCLLAVYLGFSWVPSLLAGAGFSSSLASTGITAFNLGGVAGALTGGYFIARVGSRASMLVMAALATIFATVMSRMSLSSGADVLPIMVMLTATGAMINGVQTTMYALAAHVYPAAIRATGVGTAVSFGRIGAVLTGFIGAWALEQGGASMFFSVIAGAMAVCLGALAAVSRHVQPVATEPQRH
jgi:AAHS family 4-hydroxybenzoate transporter-like MFS transporter